MVKVDGKWLASIALCGWMLGSVGCDEAPPVPVTPDCGTPPAVSSPDWVPCRLKEMTLEEKVGQLFMAHAYGTTVADTDPKMVEANRTDHGLDTAEQLVERYHLGGIIYFTWTNNLGNPEQIARLSNGLQEVAMRQERPIPLLISTDQEHGVVVRVTEPATQFPGNMALGATRNLEDARQAAVITARELSALGINLNFGTVADVNSNPLNPVIGVRSFGLDPALVSSFTQVQVNAMQGEGMAATVKHFPGHGDTEVDSHYGLPIIHRSREQFDAVDLPPFVAAIDAQVDAIMSAHIVVPALERSGLPATLSRSVMTDLLRGQLGFQGVVVSDSLSMQGAKPYGDDSDARVPVEALKAGVDMLLLPSRIDVAFNAVREAVIGGEISQERLDEAVGRILTLKQKRGVLARPLVDLSLLERVGAAEHLAVADALTERGITLVKNEAGVLPLKPEVGKVLVTGWGAAPIDTLARELTQRGLSVETLETGTTPEQAGIAQAVASAGRADITVVLVTRVWTSQAQRDLVRALQDSKKPVVVVSVREPYDISYLPGVSTFVATYGFRSVSMKALARVLVGEVNPSGRLPVAIPRTGTDSTVLYPIGHGLSF
ncbi:glycoside hydrolase family 3 protein [Melittangium boletus]|uniref:beta-N-acetylhexosaminidase n=1 Tax=Melittangium boletus DSM 14713 TaxID=1294270 RepID=A0A250I802_9BACT|nr:glycoside hydrolase family 3 protein [Melittangium boletus]ATB27301.1 beta-hexosaminidase [Melittangium boletus DSM 14713]